MFTNKNKVFKHTNSGVLDCKVTRIGLEEDECIIVLVRMVLLTLMILPYLHHRLLEIRLLL
jgi:hypothetical protein